MWGPTTHEMGSRLQAVWSLIPAWGLPVDDPSHAWHLSESITDGHGSMRMVERRGCAKQKCGGERRKQKQNCGEGRSRSASIRLGRGQRLHLNCFSAACRLTWLKLVSRRFSQKRSFIRCWQLGVIDAVKQSNLQRLGSYRYYQSIVVDQFHLLIVLLG